MDPAAPKETQAPAADGGSQAAGEDKQAYPDGTMTIYAYGQPQYLQIYFDNWLERNRDIAPGVKIEIVQTKDVNDAREKISMTYLSGAMDDLPTATMIDPVSLIDLAKGGIVMDVTDDISPQVPNMVDGADKKAIEEAIVTMPNYFADYDTTVHFISEDELMRDHAGIPHGGFVIRTGRTGWEDENSHVVEYSLKLDSNPEFTASVITAYARAAYRLSREGQTGCRTVLDIAPAYLSAQDGAELRKHLL